jgi:hypothetical protein
VPRFVVHWRAVKNDLIKPVYRILYEHLSTGFAKSSNYSASPRIPNRVFIKPLDLLEEVKGYLSENGLNELHASTKSIKTDLDALGSSIETSKVIKCGGKNQRCILFDKVKLFTILKHRFFNTTTENEEVLVVDDLESINGIMLQDESEF